MSLTSGDRNLLRLASKGAADDGWAPVSRQIWPLVAKLPDELLEKRTGRDDGGGWVRLTDAGNIVLRYA